jgi:uncharacterized FlaG/YvyC family protein
MKKILAFSLVILAISVIPSSFAWDGLIAMDADKRNVEFGDIISYEGYLYGDYIIDEESVYVTISEQETGKIILEISLIPNSTTVDYFENTAWPFAFQVGTSYQGFTDDTTYVVEAKYDDKSSKLNFLIKSDTKASLKEKATNAGDAIVEAGTETGELIIETGKEAGKVIVKAGEDAIEKGAEVEKEIDQKRMEVKETVEQKASEVISDIEETAGGGCLIATATFGSELSPQVQQLRELRDNKLLNTKLGFAFMGSFNEFYYSFSPIIADYERENPIFREAVKIAITPMISSLSILNHVNVNSEVEILGYGISLILLNIGMYVGAPAIIVVGIKKRFQVFSLD